MLQGPERNQNVRSSVDSKIKEHSVSYPPFTRYLSLIDPAVADAMREKSSALGEFLVAAATRQIKQLNASIPARLI